MSAEPLPDQEVCPVCGYAEEAIDRVGDYGGDTFEARCGDEWHDGRPVFAMGHGGPCMSCGGNDGYGPAPHHEPGCYFASQEDDDLGPNGRLHRPHERSASSDEQEPTT